MEASQVTKRFHDPNCKSIAKEGSPRKMSGRILESMRFLSLTQTFSGVMKCMCVGQQSMILTRETLMQRYLSSHVLLAAQFCTSQENFLFRQEM
jgi:hypothetical protein